ncbi:zinc finger BED domain-containing protein RICESLEEPER 2 [Tanacetum coccineum]
MIVHWAKNDRSLSPMNLQVLMSWVFGKQRKHCFPFYPECPGYKSDNNLLSFAFESAFSTSGKVLSIRRTRLTPTSLEMCMCLKDHLDATERIQHTSNLENALDFEKEILDAYCNNMKP